MIGSADVVAARDTRVSLEAGNSVSMVNKHYPELVTPEDAKRWFAIEPETQSKIVPMAAGVM